MSNLFSEKFDTNNDNKIKIRELIENRINKIKNYTPKIGVFGVTGVGKSSLCNALFGKEITKVSDVHACTRQIHEIKIGFDENGGRGIILLDVPGLGENLERDNEYKKLYSDIIEDLDLVIWVIKADDRSYSVAEEAYKNILLPHLDRCPVFFVISQIDKINPIREWDEANNKPGPTQEKNILEKEKSISEAFNVSFRNISVVSSTDNYNVSETLEKIIEILPNEKKYSVFREAKENLKNEKMEENAEKGVWQSVKDWVGNAWNANKELITEILSSSIIETASKISKKLLSFFK
ncbi:GTPase family protein [Komagataeibacter diospyri]|uniref:Small GTP-binding protein YeeP n=1 Tax=Komagataeibacter diospyri TaxID=1932662 RepID=A0A4P5P1F8_9PROT|nr:GTPase [Komagataeibacter diospyri]GCE83966.1 small GTP-binding protein YeeP [Komagataeibacter diospyri]